MFNMVHFVFFVLLVVVILYFQSTFEVEKALAVFVSENLDYTLIIFVFLLKC